MVGTILVFQPKGTAARPGELGAIFIRGIKAGLAAQSHLDDIVFKPSKHDFPKHRAVFFAGFHEGNRQRWSSQQ